jgi:hypothetical protein
VSWHALLLLCLLPMGILFALLAWQRVVPKRVSGQI